METLHFSIRINAPKQKVWDTMLNDATYREWTSVFSPGSHYVGEWTTGSKIAFLAPDEKGKTQGMVSKVVESRPPDFVSVQHLGIIADGVEDTTSAATKGWADAFENYTFREVDGMTEVLVDMDTATEHKAMFEKQWPESLQKLKALAEK